MFRRPTSNASAVILFSSFLLRVSVSGDSVVPFSVIGDPNGEFLPLMLTSWAFSFPSCFDFPPRLFPLDRLLPLRTTIGQFTRGPTKPLRTSPLTPPQIFSVLFFPLRCVR